MLNAAARFVRIDTTRLIRRAGGAAALLIISVFFLIGAITGALAGSGQPVAGEQLLLDDGNVYGYDTYALLLFDCSKYHLLVLLFSTSLFGVLLIPATLVLRGFALACSAAWIASTYTDNGTALALVVLGLPALFTVPALFVASQWGMMFSSRLLAGFMRRPLPVYRTRGENRLLAVCVMLFAAAAVEYFLVPPIVRLLI